MAPEPLVYNRVGGLYGQIQKGFETIPDLFIGTASAQDTDDWTAGLSLTLVKDRRSAVTAIQAIVVEGEGTSLNRDNSHYGRFLAIRNQLASQRGFDPARPVVRNPLVRLHRDTKDETQVHLITNPVAKLAAETFSHVYQTMLVMLGQYYSYGGESADQRSMLQASCRQLMSTALRPMAEQITQLPAGDKAVDGNAGPTFELFSEIMPAPSLFNRWIILDERLNAAAVECEKLGTVDGILARFKSIGESIRLIALNLKSANAR